MKRRHCFILGIDCKLSIIRHACQVLINRWVEMDQEEDVFVWHCFVDVVVFGTGGIRH
jgi:hypothetical protein